MSYTNILIQCVRLMFLRQLFAEPLIKSAQSAGFGHFLKISATILIAHILNLIETAKRKRFVFVDWRSHIFTVSAILHLLQLSYARHIGQSRLNVGQIRHLNRCRERIPFFVQQPPTGQIVTVVGEIGVVLRTNVDRYYVCGAQIVHHIGCAPSSIFAPGQKAKWNNSKNWISKNCQSSLVFENIQKVNSLVNSSWKLIKLICVVALNFVFFVKNQLFVHNKRGMLRTMYNQIYIRVHSTKV